MKKSDIRQIIKEEVINLIREQYLTEAFADPKLAMINKLGGLDAGWKRTFWDAAAKDYDLAWDKLPKGTLQKKPPTSPEILKPGMMTFWVVKTRKDNPYRVGYSSYTIYPGVLAVTLGGKIQYYSSGGGIESKGGYKQGSNVGKGQRGQLMVKKLKELADETYTFDLGQFRGGTTQLKAKRADLKLGKDTFKDHRAWKRANMQRYKDILDARVGSRDQVDAMVAKIVKIANEAVKTGMEVVKMNNYDRIVTNINGTEVELEYVTGAMSRALSKYAEYIRYANRAEKAGDRFGQYDDKAAKDVAGYIKKMLKAFESGNANQISRF